MKVNLAEQVRDFVLCLAPESRKQLRHALRLLQDEKGDIKALEHELQGFYRLRVRSYRVIFTYRADDSSSAIEIDCLFCERRSIVYEIFAAMSSRLRGR